MLINKDKKDTLTIKICKSCGHEYIAEKDRKDKFCLRCRMNGENLSVNVHKLYPADGWD